MPAKKISPPGAVSGLLGKDYDEVQLPISLGIRAGQIVMQFSDDVEWVRMSAAGARKLAAILITKADELDRRPSGIKKS